MKGGGSSVVGLARIANAMRDREAMILRWHCSSVLLFYFGDIISSM